MPGAVIPFSIPCPLCQVDDPYPASCSDCSEISGFCLFSLAPFPLWRLTGEFRVPAAACSPSLLSAKPPLQSCPCQKLVPGHLPGSKPTAAPSGGRKVPADGALRPQIQLLCPTSQGRGSLPHAPSLLRPFPPWTLHFAAPGGPKAEVCVLCMF